MPRTSHSTGKSRRKRPDSPDLLNIDASEYRVGPGRPPREFQFKPGQSGNPKGGRRKTASITPDLKAALECALGKKVTVRLGEQEKIITKAAAGIEQLVNQFAKGDRHARRDLIALAHTLGVDLVAGEGKIIEQALEADFAADDEALLADYLRRHRDRDACLAESKDSEMPSPNEKEP